MDEETGESREVPDIPIVKSADNESVVRALARALAHVLETTQNQGSGR